jgi:GTP cyclohydrolase II
MNPVRTGVSPVLFGRQGHTSVSRGLAEIHGRRPILMSGKSESLLALPVEGLDAERLSAFVNLCAPSEVKLIITARRAAALGLEARTPMAVRLSPDDDATSIMTLVADAACKRTPEAAPAGPVAGAAIQLMKLAQGLPAILAAEVALEAVPREADLVAVDADAVERFAQEAIKSLTLASEASVPLDSGTPARFVVFRDSIGGTSTAIIVGKPDFTNPVPVRLHSACLTGDVFGSRRCDCGDQLQLAMTRLEDVGGGVVLYLAQEGRGVGLANKMRTYQLQDDGLDTVDANTTLGFDDDERDYGIAARMLQMLNCTRIVLLTNNPAKLDGLAKAGIEIISRMPLETPINADNRRYLTAKAARAGHRLDHLMATLADRS